MNISRVILRYTAGADPGFLVAGGANRTGRGCQYMILSNFPKNCMNILVRVNQSVSFPLEVEFEFIT